MQNNKKILLIQQISMYRIIILFLIGFSFYSCIEQNNKRKENKDITGNWKIVSYKNNPIDEYLELYINKDEFYVLSEYGLINTLRYKITDDMLIHYNDSITSFDPKVEINKNKLILNFSDSTKFIYNQIEKGILPKVYIEDANLKDCYYESFFQRQEKYLKDVGNVGNGSK